MPAANALPKPALRFSPFDPRLLAIGFAFWLLFLLALEPENVAHALQAGFGLAWPEESGRILGASLLGCAATPLLAEQVRRFPVAGPRWRRNALVQAVGAIATAAALISLSCVLADWFLPSERRRLAVALPQELVANGPLVAFCIAAFIALAHAFRTSERTASDPAPAEDRSNRYLATIPAKGCGRTTIVDVADIDWLEAQGNYVALHLGRETHLIRASIARLESRLDPTAFLRVHRGAIVAAGRVASVSPLGSGDARITLKDGTPVRLSRTYRGRIGAILPLG
jgi:hypothetical protein